MDDNLDKNIEIQNKVIKLFKENKSKIIYLVSIVTIAIISFTYFKINNNNKNNLIAEKYVQAGLYLAAKENNKSQKIYEEIIQSKNKFYSILSLNNIIENNLEPDEAKILDYFEELEKLATTNDQKDLLLFKKSLYLIKISKVQEGNELLNQIINSKSKFKSLAENIIGN
jgi:predicted negative regulator of RcsB-dependent stress response